MNIRIAVPLGLSTVGVMAEPQEDDVQQPGTMRLTFGPGGLEFGEVRYPDDQYSMDIALDKGRESITERDGDEIQTKSSPFEAGTTESELHAGETLRRHLNSEASAEVWTKVIKTDESVDPDADVILRAADGRELRVQIVSADVDGKRWRFIRTTDGQFVGEDELTVDQAADRITQAIRHKEQGFSPPAKRGLGVAARR